MLQYNPVTLTGFWTYWFSLNSCLPRFLECTLSHSIDDHPLHYTIYIVTGPFITRVHAIQCNTKIIHDNDSMMYLNVYFIFFTVLDSIIVCEFCTRNSGSTGGNVEFPLVGIQDPLVWIQNLYNPLEFLYIRQNGDSNVHV